MINRIPEAPPFISPIVDDINRPKWSVMIPAYNCIAFLEETLKSVLIQDPGEEFMQIEVVDDHSTDGDVAALVEAVGKGRVKYFRQQRNRGSLRNFETCLNRSRGHLIHMLHGDDRVEPGFYKEIESLFSAYPEAGAAFTRNGYIVGTGEEINVKKKILRKPGIIKNFLLQIAWRQLLDPVAMVVKRSIYEQLGGFYAVHYGEDWEMWNRIAACFPVAYSPKCLATYRVVRGTNITQQSFLTGQNARDMKKVINIIQNYLPPEKRKRMKNKALRFNSIECAMIANGIYRSHKEAALMQAEESWKMDKNLKSCYYLTKFFIKQLPAKLINFIK